jgi:predicted site-specific integrase-resolvase
MLDKLRGLARNDVRRLLPPDIVAEALGVSVATLARWRCTGSGPTYIKAGGRIGYEAEDLEAFKARNRRASTARAA